MGRKPCLLLGDEAQDDPSLSPACDVFPALGHSCRRGGHLPPARSCPPTAGREHTAYRPRAGLATSRLVGQLMHKTSIGLVANPRTFKKKTNPSDLFQFLFSFCEREHWAALVQPRHMATAAPRLSPCIVSILTQAPALSSLPGPCRQPSPWSLS